MESHSYCADPDLLLSPDSAQRGHCRRVAALALEVGRLSDLPLRLAPVLEMAALLHHATDLVVDSQSLARIACQVLWGCSGRGLQLPQDFEPDLPPELSTVLSLLRGHSKPEAAPALRMIAGIIRMCDLIDAQMESLPFEALDINSMLRTVQSFAAFEDFDPALLDRVLALCDFGLADRLLECQFPVEVHVAADALRSLAPSRDFEACELEAIAMRDSILAVSLIRAANTALYSPARRVGSVRQAISYIGTVAARHVMLAAVLRPLFASVDHTAIWSHSVRMAQFCSAIADQTSVIESEKASLLGLIHDIGALAIRMFAPRSLEVYRRLAERGCPPTYIEQLLFGCDHGRLGGHMLAAWGFADDLRQAVTFHHQPERSTEQATALLYLAELWAGLDEDVPAVSRIQGCIERVGISLEALACIRIRQNPLGAL